MVKVEPQDIWKGFHWSFFVNIQGLIICLRRFETSLALGNFELVRHLRRHYGLYPHHLFVSGCRAPQIPKIDLPIHALPDAEFLEELRRLNGTPEAVIANAELIELLLPTLRADFAFNETYVYQNEPPLDCSITAFGGLQDPETNRDDLAAWRSQTRATFSLHMLPGDHFFLHSERSLLLKLLFAECTQFVGKLNRRL